MSASGARQTVYVRSRVVDATGSSAAAPPLLDGSLGVSATACAASESAEPRASPCPVYALGDPVGR